MWKEWKEQRYQDVFERVTAYLTVRHQSMGEAFVMEARGMLQGLYVRLGNDQEGRALSAELELEASIAAYESYLERLVG